MTTLARLTCWIDPARSDDFTEACERRLVPLLERHGLSPSSEPGRPTVGSAFTRLFAAEAPAAIALARTGLSQDAAWQETLRSLGPDFGDPADTAVHADLHLYRTPAGPGRTVSVGSGLRQRMWLSYSVQDQLPCAIIDILQVQDGTLWMATGHRDNYAGVCRFDGLQLTTFTTQDGLPHDCVYAVVEDRKGHLWLATVEGVSRYDGQQFDIFTRADGLADNSVLSLLEDRAGCLWFGTAGGVSRLDGASWVTYTAAEGLADDRVGAIVEDGAGHLWFTAGSHHGGRPGLTRFDGERFVSYTGCDGLSSSVLTLGTDGRGTLWAGTGTGDVYRYEGDRFARVTNLVPDRITAISSDDQGQMWFATRVNGVFRFDGTRWEAFTIADGLANDQVFAIQEDRQGHLWLGTFAGVSRYDQAYLTHFTVRDGLVNNGVLSMLEDRHGHLWFGTWDGVSRYDGSEWTTIEQLSGWHVWVMAEDRQGHLWFGGVFDRGLTCYDGIRHTTFTTADGLADNRVLAMLEDRQGRLWFGHSRGVSCYDGLSFEAFAPEEGLAARSVVDILEDRDGHLWFAGGDSVSRYDGRQLISFTTAEGLAGNRVRSIGEGRQGNLWFGGMRWISCYDGRSFETFTPEDGLAHGQVMDILEDRDGHLWFATSGGGVSRYDGRVFQTLSRRDGLVFDSVHALLQDRSGYVWIGTEGGVTRYRPSRIPPVVQLRAVIADQRYEPTAQIHIPASQKLVALEFQGRSWTTPEERMAYVYLLDGYDADWQPAYSGRVEYQDLPPGEYTFHVKAVDRDLNYSEEAVVPLALVPDARVAGLTDALRQSGPTGDFVGRSAGMRQVQTQLRQVAPSDMTVLIQGETGTGKGLAARILHDLSLRRDQPLIQVNCGSVPVSLAESELFGHEKGAFTGAVSRHLGKVELAAGGTLFLDEVADMPLEAQVKLLRLLEERTFERVGGEKVLTAEVRVVAATNRDLPRQVEAGDFRADLFYRLQGFELRLPPLRERREDIPVLALYFMQPAAAHLAKPVTELAPEAIAALQAYDWPGNVRELQHAVERAVVVCEGSTIRAGDLAPMESPEGAAPAAERLTLEEYERRYIRAVLADTGGVISGPRGASAILGLPESTLRTRMKKLGVERL